MDHWFPRITLPMTWSQFRTLPQHPAYRYEYLEGQARLTARLRRYHALLTLPASRVTASESGARLRPINEATWRKLPPVFAEAFAATAPLSFLGPEQRLAAATDCLERTRNGEHGLLVESASFVAVERDRIEAAIVITLLQAGDLERFDDPQWGEPPPADALESRWGRPHVTWVLTAPGAARRGLASALLKRSAQALTELGYRELASTFLLGNEASLLWHWKNGFRLLSYVGSPRRITESGST